LDHDRDLAKIIVRSALADLPDYFERMDKAIASQDLVAAEKLAHTMKGLAGQIGGLRLSEQFRHFEIHLKNGGDADPKAVAQLHNAYQALSGTLDVWLSGK
jgi:two-component system sensor histidine kinase/response regulator